MAEQEAIRRYLETVQEQIRWKRARPVLIRELEQHFTDQQDALIQAGSSPEEAERLAMEDMGDPVEIGAELDRVHRPRPQWGLLGLTLALAAAGTLLRLALTANWHLGEEPLRAVLALLLGTGALLGAYFLDISRLARSSWAVYIGAVACGLLIGIPLFHTSPHFYRIGCYLSLFLPAVYALWVYSCRGKGWPGLFLSVVGGVPLAFLCVNWYPSMANLLVLLFCGLGVLLCAVWQDGFGLRRWKGAAAVLGITAALAGAVCGRYPGFLARLNIALHPELDPLERGWFGLHLQELLQDIPLLRSHIVPMGRLTVENSGLFFDRIGMDESLGRDFLPAILAVRCGWLALLLLLAAMAGLVLWLAVQGLRQRHRLGRLMVLTAALNLGLRTVLSTVLNLGFVFVGTGFPFLGGNALLVTDMALIGLALSALRGDPIAREEDVPLRRFRRFRLRIEYL